MTKPQIIYVRNLLDIQTARPFYQQRTASACDITAVHHDAVKAPRGMTVEQSIALIKRHNQYHKDKNWGSAKSPAYGHGIMYHYFVTEAGIFQCRDENELTWNANNANRRDLAVCCSGNLEEPASQLMVNLKDVLHWLHYERPDLPGITRQRTWGHGELVQFGNQTECPGPFIKPWVQSYRAGALG